MTIEIDKAVCPCCKAELKYLTTWWYDSGCPPNGLMIGCENCGESLIMSPKTTFVIRHDPVKAIQAVIAKGVE